MTDKYETLMLAIIRIEMFNIPNKLVDVLMVVKHLISAHVLDSKKDKSLSLRSKKERNKPHFVFFLPR